jgi:hypothetical protein
MQCHDVPGVSIGGALGGYSATPLLKAVTPSLRTVGSASEVAFCFRPAGLFLGG